MEEKTPENIAVQDKNQTTVLNKPNKRKKILILVSILVILNLFTITFFYNSFKNKDSTKPDINEVTKVGSNISPTPFLFEELTIPYLKNREYESKLGELELNSENSLYTSYLANYDSDGNKINGQLTIPVGVTLSGGFPAIVFVHGYIPPASYETFGNYSSYVDYLASNGFVVFKIDLRGHGGSEGDPGGAYYSSDYIIDTLNAYAALENSDFVNPKRIGLWGHSMAGNVVSRALAAKPDIPAISIWAGAVYTYSDFADYSIEDNSYQPPSEESPSRKKRAEMMQKYGAFDPNSSFWKQVPMTNYLDGIKGAIQLNHAIDDNVVEIGYSRNFKSILDKTKIPHELNEYSSGGHNFTGGTFNESMRTTVEFFDKYLR